MLATSAPTDVDAMDVNWCLTCDRHINVEGYAPYRSRESLALASPVQRQRADPRSGRFAQIRAVNQPDAHRRKEIRLSGFIIGSLYHKYCAQFYKEILPLVAVCKIKYTEDRSVGLDTSRV
ncbi:hypothetical protein EVJ58_g7491 [Rhodofomes roseus]|uniref:Uncharacterized protein n=1 Tax=Rhodofomes roseus TaxID=34475 RepID=A0A4Y9Y5H5_9APHY|nr:hypothetical protein EVJ58_g7491 [Rhodofomes roseus]